MGKKKLKQEIKLLRRQTEKAQEKRTKAEKRVKQLKALLKQQSGQEKQAKRQDVAEAGAAAESGFGSDATASGVASSQRQAWKRHSFLRDRYEAYLAAGDCRSDARALANRDLMREFGQAFGYSDDELQDILT